MCGDCKSAVQQRTEAASKLLEACSAHTSVKHGLRLAYPLQPVPDDMLATALRIGQ
jgi:hypothetical protein